MDLRVSLEHSNKKVKVEWPHTIGLHLGEDLGSGIALGKKTKISSTGISQGTGIAYKRRRWCGAASSLGIPSKKGVLPMLASRPGTQLRLGHGWHRGGGCSGRSCVPDAGQN